MKLPNDTIKTIELKKIFTFRYKNWKSDPGGEPVEFDLSGSMLVLVGQNGSGKTNLLEAVRIFCTAVKHGSDCLSSTAAKELFGTDQALDIDITGVFDVHYEPSHDIESFELEVHLSSLRKKCEDYMKCPESPDERTPHPDETSTKECVHIHVTLPFQEMRRLHWFENFSFSCPEEGNNVFFYQTDYGVLGDLLPQVISFSSKSVLKSDLSDLVVTQNRDILMHQDEIDAEIRRIFPLIYFATEANMPKSEKMYVRPQGARSYGTPVLLKRFGQSTAYNPSLEIFKDVASFGEGVLQCFFLIATVCCAKPNSIITIDEPDAHVFPTAQRLLIDFFYRKMEAFRQTNASCKMLITTHSPDTMQAVQLKDIRQVFLDPISHIPTEIKSLSSTEQLLRMMATLGTSILGHDEIVRLGVHRKLLYLESRQDFDFMSGIIRRVKPELLHLPFTIIYKGGRPQPDQIKQLIPGFRHFIPKDSKLSIFVLVDSDLRRRRKLDSENDEYNSLGRDKSLKVKIHYHCWVAREWENWLLFDEDLLSDMLFSNELAQQKSITKLREKINNQYPQMLGTFQPNEFATTTTATTTDMLQPYSVKERFLKWFKTELFRHYQLFLNEDLTLSQMEGSGKNDQWNSKELAEEGKQFLHDRGMNDEQMEKYFGCLRIPMLQSIGAQNRKRNLQEGRSQTNTESVDDFQRGQNEWLDDRKIKRPINSEDDLNDPQVRKNLTKWIDAKKFFHQLTNDRNIEAKGPKIDLDEYWKEAFSLELSNNNYLYTRYFDKLDPRTWPDDFTKLVEDFETFVTKQ